MTLRLKHKILLIFIFPVIAILYFTVSSYLSNWQSYQTFKIMKMSINRIVSSSKIINELQIERGNSTLFLNGGLAGSELTTIRSATDKMITDMIEEHKKDSEYQDDLTKLQKNLASVRSKVEAKSVSFKENMNNYSELIDNLLAEYRDGLNGKIEKDAATALNMVSSIEEAKENLGLLRGFASGFVVSSSPMSTDELLTVIYYFCKGTEFTDSQYLTFSDSGAKMRDTLLKSQEWSEFHDAYIRLIENHGTGEYRIDGNHFFEITTKVINSVGKIHSNEIKQLTGFLKMMEKQVLFSLIFMTIFSGIIIVITLGVGIVFANVISKPLKKTVGILEGISNGEGDLTAVIEVSTKDEISVFAENFNKFTAKLREIVNTAKNVSMSGSEISKNLAAHSEETFSTIRNINQSMSSMLNKTDILDETVKNASISASEIAKSVRKIVDLIEDQASALTESSASIEEMVASIGNVTRITADRKDFTDTLTAKAKSGDESMNETLGSISDISKATEVIFEMIDVINEVAERTDLLAMNAAIEAAHAGESGKGFAVVADEIRNLAEATKEKSGEISKSLNEISDKVKSTLDITQNTGTTINELITGIMEVSDTMNEMQHSMNEMKIGSDQIIVALKSLIGITETVREASGEIESGSAEVKDIVEQVKDISTDNKNSMHEIASGLAEVSESVREIATLATDNSSNSSRLEEELHKFKT